MKPDLKIIKTTHRPVVDLYGKWRDEIRARNWEQVHVRSDRSEPVELVEGPRRGWRA